MPARDVIIIGNPAEPLYTFEDSRLKSLSMITAVDLVGNRLSVDELTPVVLFSGRLFELWAPKGYQGVKTADGYLFAHRVPQLELRKLPYATPVYWYRDGALKGKYYSHNVERVAQPYYQINAVSAIGLLDKQQHLGNIYTGQTFDVVATEIIGGVVPFKCTAAVARIKVYGWLPIGTKRKNLHQLLFAYGVSVGKDDDGNMVFCYLGENTQKAVPDNRIYYGGSVDYSSPATGVEVTEHSYSTLPVDPVTLFDNTEIVSSVSQEQFVAFDEAPVFDLQATGSLQVLDNGVNWARVFGIGTLTGRPYTHLTQVVTLNMGKRDSGTENVKRVTDVTLVNLTNSSNVAKRLLDYYSSAKTISAAISLEGEAAGDQLSLSDPFGEASVGFLERLEINVSSNLKAQCTIVTDYEPQPEKPNFTHLDILTGKGVYIVPEGVYLLRVAVMASGQGGGRGEDGQQPPAPPKEQYSNSYSDSTHYYEVLMSGLGGEGGESGKPGSGGKIFEFEMPVTPGQQIPFACGTPGNAGTEVGLPGGASAASTFADHSSEEGVIHPYGWTEPLSGTVYAKPGKAGYKGGRGSGVNAKRVTEMGHQVVKIEPVPGDTLVIDGQTFIPGVGYESKIYLGEKHGNWDTGYGAFTYEGYGASGGGPAFGANGQNGEYPTQSSVLGVFEKTGEFTSLVRVHCTTGGIGADALPPADSTLFGEGGAGGNGGGGNGALGVAAAVNEVKKGLTRGTLETVAGYRFRCGYGSFGAAGGPGAIFVYSRRPEAEQKEETQNV